jgi:hypothetical protein
MTGCGIVSTDSAFTKQSKQELFLPYIMSIVQSGQKPRKNVWDTEAGTNTYYILGTLPTNKMAIYMEGKVEVITGRDSFGTPILDGGVTYSAQSLKRFVGRNINVAERDLVLAVRGLIKHYKGTY